MSSDRNINDGKFSTMRVDGDSTLQSVVVEGNLTVNGIISPYVPGSLDLGNVPLTTLLNPLSVNSIVANISSDLAAATIDTLTLTNPDITNTTSLDNTSDLTSPFSTSHTVMHLISEVDGATPTSGLKVTTNRTDQCTDVTYGADIVAALQTVDGASSDFIGTRSTVYNASGTNSMTGTTIGLQGRIQNFSDGGITDARAGDFLIQNENTGSSNITTAVGVSSRLRNTLAASTMNTAIGYNCEMTNNTSGKMLGVECIRMKYTNLNSTVPNANYVWGVNIGGSTSPWSSSGAGSITESKAIVIGSSSAVGTDAWSLYCENGSGSIRSSSRKKRYRVISAPASSTISVHDEIIYVQSPVVSLTLPALPTVAGKGSDELQIQIRNLSSSDVTISTAGGGDTIQAIGTATATTSVTLLAQTAGTFQSTSLGKWVAIQLASSTASTGNRQNYRVLTTPATVTQLSSDSYLYVDSNTVSQVNLLPLPTIALQTIDRNVLVISNDGPNPLTVQADTGVPDLIKPVGGGANVGSLVVAAYNTLTLHATTSVWRQVGV